MQVFRRDGLVVGRVRAEKNDQIRAKPVLVAACRRGDADRIFHRGGARRVAKAGGVIDIIGAKESGDSLRHVIDFVRNAARSEEHRPAFWIRDANLRGHAAVGFVPGNATESPGAFFAQHRIRQAPGLAQLRVVKRFQPARVFQQTHIQLRHRVQSKQVQSRHAQMNTLDRPIMESSHAEGAAIANSPA